MSEVSNIYRGNCNGLKAINSVGISLTDLVGEIPSAFPGEPARKVFPVRSQLSWFRLKNENGRISTEIVARDDFMAIINATVFNKDGEQVSNAHGSADSTNDGIHGFKLVETAESRAIARALDFAGYGCQLDLNTFDGSQQAFDGTEEKPVGNDDTQFPNEAPPPTPQPGTFKGKQKIDANAGSGIVDISEMEKSETPAAVQKKGKGKKKEADTPDAGEQVPPAAAPEAVSDDGAAKPADGNETTADSGPETKEDRTDGPEPAQEAAEDVQPQADEKSPTEAEPASESSNNGVEEVLGDKEPEEGSSEEQQAPQMGEKTKDGSETADTGSTSEESKTSSDYVKEHIAMVVNNGTPFPALDPTFFAADAEPDGAVINKSNVVTEMKNGELQIAISFLQANPHLIDDMFLHVKKNSSAQGKTLRELRETPNSAMIFKSYVDLYRRGETPAYAAALILYNSMTDEKKEGSDK